jgi:GDP-D-mannose dehydratase
MEEGSEMSNHLLNNNYFIIGTYKAKQWLGDYALNAIEKISDYEKDNFGEVYTDLTDPEKIANMLSYILGEELLSESEALQMRWNTRLNKYTLQLIINELELRRGTA